MKKIFHFLLVCLLAPATAYAQEAEEPNRILFTNVNVFDGVSESLAMNTNVLVEDNLIAAVGSSITLPEGAEVIDGGGRTLMPGLIDSHTHIYATGVFQTFAGLQAAKWDQIGAMANENARESSPHYCFSFSFIEFHREVNGISESMDGRSSIFGTTAHHNVQCHFSG